MAWGISHKYKFIFFHIPSTAGTSICSSHETSLLKYICRDNGVLGGGHRSVLEIQQTYPDEFSKYYKFCVIRNPFSRFVSKFFYRRYEKFNGHVFDWTDKASQALLPQLYWITDRSVLFDPKGLKRDPYYRPDQHYGKIMVDRMIRFENLIPELSEVLNELGVPVDLDKMPNIHKLHDADDYKQYYDDRLRSLVSFVYRDDLKRFGYTW